MKKIIASAMGILIALSVPSWPQGIRKSLLAGTWYHGDPEQLSRHIDHLLQNVEKDSLPAGEVAAIIVPHAGYVFSGQVAAYAYQLIKGQAWETVVILSPSHHFGFEGCSIYQTGGYETPLGTAEVDTTLANQISKATGFTYIARAHREEHAVEIQVPFIQKVLPHAKIVPIVMGYPRKNTIMNLANGLKKVLSGKKVLILASTDLSHFLSKKDAHMRDQKTIAQIKAFEIDSLIKKCKRGENIMCGGGPVLTALLYAQNKAKVEILKYSDSSQVNRDEERVVGYLAAALVTRSAPQEFQLTDAEKKELVELARSTIELFVRENKIPEYETENPRLIEKKGAFVTIKKRGQLRGCIGFIESRLPLYQSIMQTAVYAACRDTRFLPVREDELDELEIEISVLSPLRKIDDPQMVKIGKHGLVIAKNGKKGLLLPQVPVENHWDQKTFLERTCTKAGLPKDAWRRGADIFVFEAIIFH